MSARPFKRGDAVVVKPGVSDPDSGADISGWQGRVSAIHDEATTLLEIRWDSITLQQMPAAYIAASEEQGLDWAAMVLDAADVLPARVRDSQADVERVQAALERQHGWLSVGGEQGQRIQQIVNSATGPGEMDEFAAWHRHLAAQLQFPFEARATDAEGGPVRQGDTVKVLDITMLDDTYGTIVAVKHKRGLFEFPLCDLAVSERTSPNYTLVDDYSIWFANR
jgi:hypothetical protein